MQQGPLQIPNTSTIRWIRSEYTEYSGKSSKGALKWQKDAIPAQEISKNSEQLADVLVLHADREKLISKTFHRHL